MSSRLMRPAFAAAARQTAPRTAIRTYAAAAVDSKPPVALFGLDGTYANALVRDVKDMIWRLVLGGLLGSWKGKRGQGIEGRGLG